jgi:hypothetical protein
MHSRCCCAFKQWMYVLDVRLLQRRTQMQTHSQLLLGRQGSLVATNSSFSPLPKQHCATSYIGLQLSDCILGTIPPLHRQTCSGHPRIEPDSLQDAIAKTARPRPVLI